MRAESPIGLRRNRSFAAAVLVAAVALVVAACGGSSSGGGTTADGKTVLRYEGSPASVTFPELAEDLGYFEKVQLEWLGDTTSGPQSIQSAATGETDFGAAFNGAIAKLVDAGAPLTGVVSVYGSDGDTEADSFNGYYVLDGSPIRSARDLIGKKVGINTLGAYHEYVIKEWLFRAGLTNDEINQVELTVVPPNNTEQALRSGQIDVGNLGGIVKDAALGRGGLTPLFTDVDLTGPLGIGAVVFRNDFISKNEDSVRDFVQGVARAVRWTQTVPKEEVVDRFVKIVEGRGRNESTEFVRQWKSAGVPAAGGVIDPGEFQIWIDQGVRLGVLKPGGTTAEGLFTNEYNPYANGTYPPGSDADGNPVVAAG
ncbi:ABC transporter substrate-binding protein [Rhodococcus sp. NCIMB 12038]|uniref:ABC transporter substrate-binding protein n=1 Tax=Rhodococcus sp. NCIMB 12038 TaxID=933800 RepID=UPI000B3CB4F1|nr:ABC transporter substrate-binding protein [Rhodococcus sp. NCIMB 12038]OUS94646.1 ABC transporter substrate-binding protein [Rhodococcus sp. NCIMB 12038]